MSNLLNLVSEETFSEKMDTANRMLAAIASGAGGIAIQSFADLQQITRLGLASKILSIGDQVSCKKGNSILVWDVIGIDHDTPSDPHFTHSVTLCYHSYSYNANLNVGERQALFYFPQAKTAGTYYFRVTQEAGAPSDVGKYFSFRLPATPAKTQLVLQGAFGASLNNTTVKLYSHETGNEIETQETITITRSDEAPASGTSLGDVNCSVDLNHNVNSLRRALLGSNDYSSSAIRQYLNSSAAAGSVWSSKSRFDVPPLWRSNLAGFLNGMDEDFLSALGVVQKTTLVAPTSFGETAQPLTTSEKVFLLSVSEVYGATGAEGTPYPYFAAPYSDLSAPGNGGDSNRIKYSNGGKRSLWLRSPYFDNSLNNADVRYINKDSGAINVIGANTMGHAIAPALCIV